MSTTFLIRRGQRTVDRKSRAHLARFNEYGDIVAARCGLRGFEISSNVPWGLKVCKSCLRRWESR